MTEQLQKMEDTLARSKTTTIVAIAIAVALASLIALPIVLITRKPVIPTAIDTTSGLTVRNAKLENSANVLTATGIVTNRGDKTVTPQVTVTIKGSSGKWVATQTCETPLEPGQSWKYRIHKFTRHNQQQAIKYSAKIQLTNVTVNPADTN